MDIWGSAANIADVIQAAVVIGSIAAAWFRYKNTKITQARVAVVQMLNLLDEFPVFVSDEDRFKYKEYLLDSNHDQKTKVSPPSWADMATDVVDFREGFRRNLQELWLSLDSKRLFYQTSDQETMKKLNNSGNVLKALNQLIFVLKSIDADHDSNLDAQVAFADQVQHKKNAVVNQLCAFAESLCEVSASHEIFKLSSEGQDYTPALFDYRDWYDEFMRCAKIEFAKDGVQTVALPMIYKKYNQEGVDNSYDNKLIPADFRIQAGFSYLPTKEQKRYRAIAWQQLKDGQKEKTLGDIFRDQLKKYYLTGNHKHFVVGRHGKSFELSLPPVEKNPESGAS